MENLRAEDQIIASWNSHYKKPLVSILCTAYNHEAYIEDAIKGFLTQETRFPFEILIHDDASLDNTANIIKMYKAKYPKIIKTIYQKQNKKSQGIKPMIEYNAYRAKGLYSTLCDGDDYWISKKKLQIQTEIMRQNPKMNISFHPAYRIDLRKKNKKKLLSNYGSKKKFFSADEVIIGNGEFMPSASLMIKSKILKNLPEWVNKEAPAGDVYIQIISSIHNGALYIPNLYSVYRANVKESWTSMLKTSSHEKIYNDALNHEKCLNTLNKLTNKFYQKSFYNLISSIMISCSYRALNKNFYKLFKKLVTKSLAYKSNFNIRKFVFVLFLNYPKFLKNLLKIKKYFIK